jgi:hypothetical protein
VNNTFKGESITVQSDGVAGVSKRSTYKGRGGIVREIRGERRKENQPTHIET